MKTRYKIPIIVIPIILFIWIVVPLPTETYDLFSNSASKEKSIKDFEYEITGKKGGAGSHTKSELFVTRSDGHSVELSKDLYYTEIILFSDWEIHTHENYVFVSWITSEQSLSDVFLAVSDDYGKTFDVKNITQSKAHVYQYKVDYSRDTIYFVWQHEFVTEDNHKFGQIYFTKSDNFGESFGQQKLLSSFDKPAQEFELEAFGDNVFVAWREEGDLQDDKNMWFATSTNKAEWFDREAKMLAAHIDADSHSDILHLTWVSVENDTQIWYAYSEDLGKTLDSRIVFDADWNLSPYAQRPIPEISVDDGVLIEFEMNDKNGMKTPYQIQIFDDSKFVSKSSTEQIPEPEMTARYEKYLDENNELNFSLQYDKNGMIIDDLQRIYDWCDYTGEKPAHWYFDWNNQTHHIDSNNCQWEQTWDGYSQPFGKQNEN